jgi:MoaA/NifB/PqqE/SkfB family radical SAM enzyme
MPEELYKKIINDIKAFDSKLKNLKFIGPGDELTHPKAIDFIEYACKAEVAYLVEITTNGTLLNKEKCDRLIDCGLGRINISVEALSSQGYYDITGNKIDFGKFADTIRYFYEAKTSRQSKLVIYVKIADVALQGDDKELFFRTFGDICDEIFVEHIVPAWSGIDDTSTAFVSVNQKETEVELGEFNQVASEKLCCPFPFNKMYITPDGLCYLCTPTSGCYDEVSDLRECALKEIWEGEKLYKFQKAHLLGKRKTYNGCKDCTVNKYVTVDNLDNDREELLVRLIERGKKLGYES